MVEQREELWFLDGRRQPTHPSERVSIGVLFTYWRAPDRRRNFAGCALAGLGDGRLDVAPITPHPPAKRLALGFVEPPEDAVRLIGGDGELQALESDRAGGADGLGRLGLVQRLPVSPLGKKRLVSSSRHAASRRQPCQEWSSCSGS